MGSVWNRWIKHRDDTQSISEMAEARKATTPEEKKHEKRMDYLKNIMLFTDGDDAQRLKILDIKSNPVVDDEMQRFRSLKSDKDKAEYFTEFDNKIIEDEKGNRTVVRAPDDDETRTRKAMRSRLQNFSEPVTPEEEDELKNHYIKQYTDLSDPNDELLPFVRAKPGSSKLFEFENTPSACEDCHVRKAKVKAGAVAKLPQTWVGQGSGSLHLDSGGMVPSVKRVIDPMRKSRELSVVNIVHPYDYDAQGRLKKVETPGSGIINQLEPESRICNTCYKSRLNYLKDIASKLMPGIWAQGVMRTRSEDRVDASIDRIINSSANDGKK